MRRIIFIILGLLIACCAGSFLLIQVIPYGRAHQNPPVLQEPAWDSPRTRDLARRACYDCHSNETAWPWYSNIAPVSWLVQIDVDEGRSALNFSEWNTDQEPDRIVRSIQEGDMPPGIYMLQHPDARLTQTETDELIAGLQKTFQLNNGGADN